MKNKKHFLMKGFLTLFLSISVLTVFGQNLTVQGTVTDEKNEPIIGASVTLLNELGVGTVTNVKGEYTLKNVSPKATLQFSYIGMTMQSIPVKGQTQINVVLQEGTKTLNEVTITAFGIPKQDKSVGYATSKVSTSEIERINVINPVNAIQGKVAGVNINVGGASGITSSSSITIRGAKSPTKNSSPIWVVDGMVLQEDYTNPLSGTDWGSQLKNLNPADYESVTVLKGAAATALYGSRGANGAIVIVSKGGKFGKKGLGVEVSQILETADIYKSPIAFQNIYGAGAPNNGYEGGFLADGSLQKASTSFGPKMDGSIIDQYMPDGKKTPFVSHPDNWKSLYQSGLNSTTNVAISGGGEKSAFRLSYSFMDNNGVFKRNEFTRHALSFKGSTELNRVFSLEAAINYAFSTAQNGANQGGWNWGGNVAMMSTYYSPRNMDIATYQDTYRDPITHAVESTTPWGTLRGYLHTRDMNLYQRSENSLLSNLTLKAKILPWLTASVKGNYNYYGISTLTKEYGTGANYGPSGSGKYGRGGNVAGSYNFLGMLQSTGNELKIGNEKITLDAIVGSELYGNLESHSWSKETAGGLDLPGVFTFSNSKNTIVPKYDYSPRNSQSFALFAILNLSWRDQLFLELTGRNDWLSTLTYPTYAVDGQNNYTVFYPSANLSWVFSETFKMPEWLSFGKLRTSLAYAGMGTNAYATTEGFGGINQSSQYDANRNSVLLATADLGTAYNNNLKPEIQRSIEIGADLRFFKERLTLDFAYYKTNTFNQILVVPTVMESGYQNARINGGNIQNQGVEIQLEGTPIRTRDFRWTIGSNFTLNRGKLIKLNDYVKERQFMGQYDAGAEIWAYEGGDFGVLTTSYGSPYGAAIYRFKNDKDPNDPRNGKPVIAYDGMYGSPNAVVAYAYVNNVSKGIKDRVTLGKVEADFLLSFNTSLSYKNFDFYSQIDGRVGGKYFSNTYKYASSRGVLLSSLNGRDKEHGGLPRVNYKGETVYDAINLDAVFDEGEQAPLASDPKTKIDVGGLTYAEALKKGIMPMMASTYYWDNLGWGMPAELAIQDNTWFCLREITLGYRLPENICNKFGANYFRIGLTARNVGYLLNKLTDGLNPEAISSNNPLTPMDIGGVPFSRTFSLNLTLKF